jgi:hypothetical protein
MEKAAMQGIEESSEIDLQRPRAMSISDFCERYGPGRTTTYQEIKAGRLRARKCGARTIILVDDAEHWLRSLPRVVAEEPRS